MVSATPCYKSYTSLASYHVLSFSVDISVVVVVAESCVTLILLSILIDIGVVVVLTGSFVTSMLTGLSVSLVLSTDLSHESVLFRILSLSGCAASNSLTLVAGQI